MQAFASRLTKMNRNWIRIIGGDAVMLLWDQFMPTTSTKSAPGEAPASAAPPSQKWEWEWELVESMNNKGRKALMCLLSFLLGLMVLPVFASIASFSIDDRDPIFIVIPCLSSTPETILCAHHKMVICASWILQSLLFHKPEESMISALLLPLLFGILVWQTWRWETFDDYYLLKRVVSVVTTYSLDPFWTIWWRLSQLFIVMSVWRFLKAKWQSICEAVVFYDKQDSWILCSSFIGFICSLCTWSYWADYVLHVDIHSTKSFILGLIIGGHIILRQIPDEILQSYSVDRKMNWSRIIMLAHFCGLVKIYEEKLWNLRWWAGLPVAAGNVVFFGLLIQMNREHIMQEIKSFLAGPQQDPLERLRARSTAASSTTPEDVANQ